MNYFELHIGDYDSATAHLSILEDGIYGRLLRLYYRTEMPIPADLAKTCRLVRATSKSERDAVQTVLGEFFTLDADGWHNARCDAEIERFVAGEPEREVKAANEKNRLQKHREERAALFKQLTDAGQHAAWNIPMGDLRELVKRIGKAPAPPAETPPPPLPATAPATPATATQAPVPNSQPPLPKEFKPAHPDATTLGARDPGEPEPPNPAPVPGSGNRYGLAALSMRQKGMGDAHPGDQRLRALVDADVSIDEFEAVAVEALSKTRGFAWALTVLTNRRAEIAAAPIAAKPEVDWRTDRSTIVAHAVRLGLPTWADVEAEDIRKGKTPSFPAYLRSVEAADAAQRSPA